MSSYRLQVTGCRSQVALSISRLAQYGVGPGFDPGFTIGADILWGDGHWIVGNLAELGEDVG